MVIVCLRLKILHLNTMQFIFHFSHCRPEFYSMGSLRTNTATPKRNLQAMCAYCISEIANNLHNSYSPLCRTVSLSSPGTCLSMCHMHRPQIRCCAIQTHKLCNCLQRSSCQSWTHYCLHWETCLLLTAALQWQAGIFCSLPWPLRPLRILSF